MGHAAEEVIVARTAAQKRHLTATDWRFRLYKLWYAAKGRAERKGLDFEITLDWIMGLLEAQNYQCAQTLLPFKLRCPDTGETKNPWSPSLDRIDSSLGYTPENVQLVCMMYNVAKSSFSDDNVCMFAHSLVDKYKHSQ